MNYPKNNDVTELIVMLAKLYKPWNYLEIGTQRGYTFCKVAPYVERAWAVDIHIEGKVFRSAYDCFETTSDRFFKTHAQSVCLSHGLFDMVFIDGLHTSRQVVKDVINALKYIVVGTGLILVHDTYPITKRLEGPDRCWDAWKAIHELKLTHGTKLFEMITLPGPYYGLTLIRRVTENAHFGIERLDV